MLLVLVKVYFEASGFVLLFYRKVDIRFRSGLPSILRDFQLLLHSTI